MQINTVLAEYNKIHQVSALESLWRLPLNGKAEMGSNMAAGAESLPAAAPPALKR